MSSRYHSSGNYGRRTRRYWRFPRHVRSSSERDRGFWRHMWPDWAAEYDRRRAIWEREREAVRIKPDEADKAQELTVQHIDLLNGRDNAKRHRTQKYVKKIQPVLRRGQEFVINLTFNRNYRKELDDLVFIFKADEGATIEDLSEGLYAEFKMDETSSAESRKGDNWSARLLRCQDTKMAVEIYIPANAVVGQWELEVKTSLVGKEDDYVYECAQPLFILFNPFCSDDQVCFTDNKRLLREYIFNESGTFFYGSDDDIGSRSWLYGQFDEGILEICTSILRKAFDFKMTADMADPVLVSRALSRIVNSQGDNGVLVGNWSGSYGAGDHPSSWTSSQKILEQYEDSKKPVKYGQCWVFSHVLTTVCRALGLPCRSVTNFQSAHDTDETCTIDHFVTEDGDTIPGEKKDSVWNFHVWNEVWMCRPDLDRAFDGWHVIDATPQEMSGGTYQCGPCPVEAVRKGQTDVGMDTAFVFSEVNADEVFWIKNAAGGLEHANSKTSTIGKKISTKAPDGKPHQSNLSWYNQDDPKLRLDLTNTYKFQEGSNEEREAVEKAVRGGRHARRLYKPDSALKVKFRKKQRTVLGKDLVITAVVKNKTSQSKTFSFVVSVRTSNYWDTDSDGVILSKEKHPMVNLRPREKEVFQVTVTEANYMGKVNRDMCIYGYACATDLQDNKPYCAKKVFMLTVPELVVKGPKTANSGQPVNVTVCFTNEQPTPLTNCRLALAGSLDIAREDTNAWESNSRRHVLKLRDLPPKKSFAQPIRLVGTLKPEDEDEDEDEDKTKMMQVNFSADGLPNTSDCTYVLDLF